MNEWNTLQLSNNEIQNANINSDQQVNQCTFYATHQYFSKPNRTGPVQLNWFCCKRHNSPSLGGGSVDDASVSTQNTRAHTACAWCVLWPAADLPHGGPMLFFRGLANYPGEKHGIWAWAINLARQLDWPESQSLDIHTEELRSSSELNYDQSNQSRCARRSWTTFTCSKQNKTNKKRSGKHFSSSWLAVDSFTSAPLSITVRYGAVACVKPIGFTRRAASDPIPFPFPLSNGSDQNHKHTTCEQWKSVRKGKTVNCFQGMNGERARAVSHNLRICQLFRKRTISHLYPAVLLRPLRKCFRKTF